jgi:hypothetical protein
MRHGCSQTSHGTTTAFIGPRHQTGTCDGPQPIARNARAALQIEGRPPNGRTFSVE